MIHFPITLAMLVQAKQESLVYENKLNNSILDGRGTTAGIISELHFKSYFPNAIRAENYSHDFILNGYKIEIKTKRRSVDPQPSYNSGIFSSSKHQVDPKTTFVFYSLNHKTHRGTLCGYMNSVEFFEKCKHHKSGDDLEGMICKSDCHSLPYRDLYTFKEKTI